MPISVDSVIAQCPAPWLPKPCLTLLPHSSLQGLAAITPNLLGSVTSWTRSNAITGENMIFTIKGFNTANVAADWTGPADAEMSVSCDGSVGISFYPANTGSWNPCQATVYP